MDLTRLRYFERVARLASFTRAAQELHVAQPALSKQVAAMEHELGERVFERSGHSIFLTDAGRRLLTHAERILEDFARLQADMGQHEGATGNTQLRLGASPTIADYLLPEVIATFRRQHTYVQLFVDSNLSDDLTKDLVEGRLDAAVTGIPSFDRLVRDELLFEEEYVLLMPPGHAWTHRREVPFRDLREVPLIVPPHRRGYRDFLAAASREHGFPVTICAEVTSHTLTRQLVRDGMGVALVPSISLDDSLPWAHIVEPRIMRQIGWLERSGSPGTSARHAFHELLLERCQRLQLLSHPGPGPALR